MSAAEPLPYAQEIRARAVAAAAEVVAATIAKGWDRNGPDMTIENVSLAVRQIASDLRRYIEFGTGVS